MAITRVPSGPAQGPIRPIRNPHPVQGVKDAGELALLARRGRGIPMSSMNPRLAGGGIVTTSSEANMGAPANA